MHIVMLLHPISLIFFTSSFLFFFFFFLMIRRPPRSTLFPYRRSSDLHGSGCCPTRRGIQWTYALHAWFDKQLDRKSTRLNSSHSQISYAVFCLKKKKKKITKKKERKKNKMNQVINSRHNQQHSHIGDC